MDQAETTVQAPTYEQALDKAMDQLSIFFRPRGFMIYETNASVERTTPDGTIIWNCCFYAKACEESLYFYAEAR